MIPLALLCCTVLQFVYSLAALVPAQTTGRIAANTWHNNSRLFVFREIPLGSHNKGLLHEYDLFGFDVLGGGQVTTQFWIMLLPEGLTTAFMIWPMLFLVLPVAISNHFTTGTGKRGSHTTNCTRQTKQRHL